jgi:hypothetical protein
MMENYGQEAVMRKKWLEIWQTIAVEVLKLPTWMQDIVLDDINTAIKNRVTVMEMILNANNKT